jgi:pimeloyl-ACP methyl ester carboxylesterase
MIKIESLLSARLHMSPQRHGDRITFISNLSGHLSLYSMDVSGSVPEPLIPPDIALQNPILMSGKSFHVFQKFGKILVMIDQDGDENYQPMLIPLNGGIPEPAFGDRFLGYRVHLGECYPEENVAYFIAESRQESLLAAFRGDLNKGDLQKLYEGTWLGAVYSHGGGHERAVLLDSYSAGDHVIYLWHAGEEGRQLLYGTPLEDREEGQSVALNAIQDCCFTMSGEGVLCMTAVFEDTYGLGYLPLGRSQEIEPVAIQGQVHEGHGELVEVKRLAGTRYRVSYNIDGCSWGYEGTFDEGARTMRLTAVLYGQRQLSQGVVQASSYDEETDSFCLSFSSATSPAQLFTVEGDGRDQIITHTRERILGIPRKLLSPGEDASYQTFDDRWVSARLYLPSPELGFEGPRPLVYYLHGGPQSQEKPDFTWFSMPLIQFLGLHGFAVFVPNVRGSTGYGLEYTKLVDRDWGGDDRLDHVHAMKVLQEEPRVDVSRAGVVGRSYGGYMTLTLAFRHPDLWSAAVDMFGPYDLTTFMDRLPETWKPYFKVVLGDPEVEADRELMIERSPRTYMDQLGCPMLVIQGKNDPRVVERESRELVEELRGKGKEIKYLMFENEGHDVLKLENRVKCYNAIKDFFVEYLQP